jgi:hypothetical protein
MPAVELLVEVAVDSQLDVEEVDGLQRDVNFLADFDDTAVRTTWDRCYDFKNIFAFKIGEKMALLVQTTACFCKK